MESEIDHVALWVGLISSIFGIALSIWALVFSIIVNNRASDVSDKTIQSLQKIESAVERLSSDTNNLIKAAWEKLLTRNDHIGDLKSINEQQELVSGATSELKNELKISESDFNRIENTLKSIINSQAINAPQVDVIDILKIISSMRKETIALLIILLNNVHLTGEEYKELSNTSNQLSMAIKELREKGFIAPLEGYRLDGEKNDQKTQVVYWFPIDIYKKIKSAAGLLPSVSGNTFNHVKSQLEDVGYRVLR